MSIKWLALSGGGADAGGPQPEDSVARELRGPEDGDNELSCRRTPSALQLGCSESIDPENVGDIADEGAGQRG
jgi:hypothetical protein